MVSPPLWWKYELEWWLTRIDIRIHLVFAEKLSAHMWILIEDIKAIESAPPGSTIFESMHRGFWSQPEVLDTCPQALPSFAGLSPAMQESIKLPGCWSKTVAACGQRMRRYIWLIIYYYLWLYININIYIYILMKTIPWKSLESSGFSFVVGIGSDL